jgi:hypothetical protein
LTHYRGLRVRDQFYLLVWFDIILYKTDLKFPLVISWEEFFT